jgi:hypothetical protein
MTISRLKMKIIIFVAAVAIALAIFAASLEWRKNFSPLNFLTEQGYRDITLLQATRSQRCPVLRSTRMARIAFLATKDGRKVSGWVCEHLFSASVEEG